MTDTPRQAAAPPSKETIRSELEAARTAYHELLDSISPEDWNKKTGNPAWNVRQLMWHIAWSNGYVPQSVEQCRKGRNFNPPSFIADTMNSLMTRFGSRGATPESVAQKYDGAHEKILACLDGVQNDEWSKASRNFNTDLTVESCFRDVPAHLEEHRLDILEGLGRQ